MSGTNYNNKPKVVLVYPPSDKGRYEHHFLRTPTVGVGYLASSLEKEGIPCSILDAKFDGLSSEEVCKTLIQERPDVIGISALTPEIQRAASLAAKIKEHLPETLIVVGGVHAMILPKKTLEENPAFDALVTGEGELVLPQIIRVFRERQSFEHLHGVAFRRDGEVQVNPRTEYIKDLDALPFPAWDKYSRSSHLYCIISSRGCPYNCAFCMTIMGKKVRARSVENVVDEMEWIVNKFGPREIVFSDETFTMDLNRTDEFLEEILARGLERKIKWAAQTRVDRINYELLTKLRRAGCYRIEFGVESGNREILKRINKKISLEQVEKAVALAKKASMIVGCTFILGHPYETRKTIQDTIDLIVKLNPNTVGVGIMVPYPGTQVYEIARRGEGNYRLLSSGWNDYLRFAGGGLEMQDISRHELERLQLKAYLSFYLKNYRFWDLLSYWWGHRQQAAAVLRKLLQAGNSKAVAC
jgi:radical SAM superfamily enzyme YgiQ (UPF0313 family)